MTGRRWWLLSWLNSLGLRGVRVITGDKAVDLAGSIDKVFPGAAYQRYAVRFYHNALAKAPSQGRPEVGSWPRPSIPWSRVRLPRPRHSRWSWSSGKGPKLKEAVGVIVDGCAETLAYTRSSASVGGGSGPTTPSSDSTARCTGVPAWSRNLLR